MTFLKALLKANWSEYPQKAAISFNVFLPESSHSALRKSFRCRINAPGEVYLPELSGWAAKILRKVVALILNLVQMWEIVSFLSRLREIYSVISSAKLVCLGADNTLFSALLINLAISQARAILASVLPVSSVLMQPEQSFFISSCSVSSGVKTRFFRGRMENSLPADSMKLI